jgi:hypothetical protein
VFAAARPGAATDSAGRGVVAPLGVPARSSSPKHARIASAALAAIAAAVPGAGLGGGHGRCVCRSIGLSLGGRDTVLVSTMTQSSSSSSGSGMGSSSSSSGTAGAASLAAGRGLLANRAAGGVGVGVGACAGSSSSSTGSGTGAAVRRLLASLPLVILVVGGGASLAAATAPRLVPVLGTAVPLLGIMRMPADGLTKDSSTRGVIYYLRIFLGGPAFWPVGRFWGRSKWFGTGGSFVGVAALGINVRLSKTRYAFYGRFNSQI